MGGNGEEPRRFVAADVGDRLVGLAWFPDSERLGYLKRSVGARNLDVGIMSRGLKESQSWAVFTDPRLVAFRVVSDGRILVSLADSPVNARGFDLWEIKTDLRTGQASSCPRRLTNWSGSSLVDFSVTADGKHLAYLDGTADYDVYIAEHAEDGLSLKPPRRLTLDDSLDFPGAWTPDGKAILFTSNRNGNLDIFKQALNQRTAEAILAGPEDECDPYVSPDGAWILYFDLPTFRRFNSTEPVTLRRLSLSGGPSQVVMSEPGFCCISCARSEANVCVMDKRIGDDLIFYALDPVQGMGRELTRIREPIVHWWRVSHDGSSIAMTTPERGGGIRILSLTGEPARDIPINEPIDDIAWSVDGRGFYAATIDAHVVTGAVAGSYQKLLFIDLDGSIQTLWQSGNFNSVYTRQSPDGRYIALEMGRMAANAWIMENF